MLSPVNATLARPSHRTIPISCRICCRPVLYLSSRKENVNNMAWDSFCLLCHGWIGAVSAASGHAVSFSFENTVLSHHDEGMWNEIRCRRDLGRHLDCTRSLMIFSSSNIHLPSSSLYSGCLIRRLLPCRHSTPIANRGFRLGPSTVFLPWMSLNKSLEHVMIEP